MTFYMFMCMRVYIHLLFVVYYLYLYIAYVCVSMCIIFHV